MSVMNGGETIGGRFVLRESVGEGGMGRVLRAEDLTAGRAVALDCMTSVADECGPLLFRRSTALTLLARRALNVGDAARALEATDAAGLAPEDRASRLALRVVADTMALE